MANLENLNFEVILKDDTFRQQIDAVQKLADRFNISMSQALALTGAKGGAQNVRELAGALRDAAKAQRDLNTAVKESPAEKITIRHRDAVTATNDKLFNMARMLRTIGTLTGGAFSVVGLRRFLSTLMDVTGQFEVQKMALRTILQDIDAADKIFQDLYRFSSDSTYRFSELAKYSKQLAAFNIGKDSLLETTKMLGDVASGVGVSMDRLILAYGHVKSSGFLRGIQLRSFSQNGVPVLDELAKMFSKLEDRYVSLGEVFDKMTKREIPFEMVEQAFKNMTSEGGKFYQMQEVLSKTLAGQMNILKGRWENLMYAIGQSQEGLLKGAVSSISNLISNYEDFGRAVKEIVVVFGIYKATQIGVLAVTDSVALANLRLVKTFRALSLSNPYMILAAAIAAAAYSIYKIETALTDVEKIQKTVNKSVEGFNTATNAEIGELDALYAKLKLAQEGTTEYDSTIKAIQNRFGTYIDQLHNEGIAVDNLSMIYDNLADKIRDANKERFLESSMADLGKTWGDVQKDINSEFKDIVSGIEKDLGRALTELEKQALERTVTGNIAVGTEELVASTIAGIYSALDADAGAVKTRNTGLYGRAQATSRAPMPNYQNRLQDLTGRYSTAMTEYANSVTKLQTAFDTLNKSVATNNNEEEELVYRISSIVQGINDLDSKIEKIRGEAKNGSITAAQKVQLDKLVAEREEAAKEYKSIMGVDYDKDVKSGESAAAKAAKKREQELRDEIQSLNKQASLVQKYKDVYDTLLPYMGENTPSALESLFGRKFDDTDFDTQLDRLIVKLATLGEEGRQAAESLRAALGKDEASELKKSLEAQDKAAEMLSAYLEKDFGIEGEGVAVKISKTLVDLANKNKKSEQDLKKFIEQLDKEELAQKVGFMARNGFGMQAGGLNSKEQERAADAYWMRYRAGQIKAWREKMRLEQQANKKLSNEKIVGLADDLFKSMTGGFDLTNFNDKTISQLETIRAGLLSLSFPADIAAAIEDPETLERFSEVLDKLQGDALKKVDTVLNEKKVGAARRLAGAFQNIGAAMSELGEATGNDILSGVGDILSVAEEITSVITENESLMKSILGTANEVEQDAGDIAKSADWITMIIKLALIVVKQFTNYFSQAKEEAMQLNEALIESRDIMFHQNLSNNVESIFGKNFVQQLRNARAELKQLNLDMGGTMANFSGEWQTFIRKGVGFWGLGTETMSLMDASSKLGVPVWDAYGNINAELLKLIQNTYKLNDASADKIQRLLEYSERYAEIIETVKDMMDGVFGNIAESAADNIIDSWIEAGNAALDYADILDDVAKSYSKMLIQSAILDEVLNEDEIKRVMAMFMGGDYEKAMSTIADDMQKIADMEPLYEEILKAFDPYFNKESDSTLANGIKGITEDTANLLASYLNAIRADVSMLRALNQSGWATVDAISGTLSVLPTLSDHLARIEAHNADINANTREILSELRGVITSSSGRRAVAVDVQ